MSTEFWWNYFLVHWWGIEGKENNWETARVDFIPGHPLLQSLYIPLQAIYITFENEAQMRQENNVLMHCKRRRQVTKFQTVNKHFLIL